MAQAPNDERRLNLLPRADYLDDSDGLEDYSLGDDESIVSWDDIDSVKAMENFISSKLRGTTLPWDLCDFGVPSKRRKIDPAKIDLLQKALDLIPKLRRITITLRLMDLNSATYAEIVLARSPFVEEVVMRNEHLSSCHPELLSSLARGLSHNVNTRRKHVKLKNVVLSDMEAAMALKSVGRINNLTEIKCRNCSKGIAKALLDAAAQSPTLRVAKFGHERDLDLEWENTISFSFRNLIGSSHSLQKLEMGPVSPSFLDNAILPLSMNRSLQELSISGSVCFATDWEQTGKRIGSIIVASQSIKKLNLKSFRLHNAAWNEIAAALKKNDSLLELHLDWDVSNSFVDKSLTAPDFRNLTHGNGVLKELRIAGEYICIDRIKDFQWAMGEMNLESLILSRVRTEFLVTAFAGLAFNRHVQKIDVEVKFISALFVKSMRELVQANQYIKSLVIRCTGHGNFLFDGVSALFENKICRLESLGLHGFSIIHSAESLFRRLLVAVTKTKSFKSLSLEGSTLDVASYRILCKVLPNANHLRHLSFTFPSTLLSRDMGRDLLPLMHEQFLFAMTANQSLTSIRVHPFPSNLKKCVLSYCNRNRLRLFQEDETASPAFLPRVFAALRNNGSDHSAVYLTLKRYLDVLPTGGSVPSARKRPRLSDD